MIYLDIHALTCPEGDSDYSTTLGHFSGNYLRPMTDASLAAWGSLVALVLVELETMERN